MPTSTKRQALKYKWEVEAAKEPKKMDVIRCGYLTQTRSALSQLPYNYWVKQYDDHSSYNVKNEIRDDVCGAVVTHTSKSNSGYFILDVTVGSLGEECPCEDQWAMQCSCHHFIAKRVFRGEEPFCQHNIHHWNIFNVEIPTSKAGNATNHNQPTIEFFGDDSNSNICFYLPSLQSTEQVQTVADNLVYLTSASQASQKMPASPSKSGHPNVNNATTTQFASKKPRNIGYAQLLKECNKLANISSHLSNKHIHVVYSMLVGTHKVVETSDHDPNNHKGKILEVFVKQIAALGGVSVQASAGGAKRKNINSYGP
eukprot:5553287-Ditylum_brightwellii.AAC.1